MFCNEYNSVRLFEVLIFQNLLLFHKHQQDNIVVLVNQNTYYYKAVAEVEVLHESKENIIETILKSSI